VEDVTELVRLRRTEAEQGKLTGELRTRADQMEAELFLRGGQLAESQRLVREREEVEAKLLASEALFSLAFAGAHRNGAADPRRTAGGGEPGIRGYTQ
jgi:hypothetical protein